MNIVENVALSNYSTMRLGGSAAYLTEVHSRQEVAEAFNWAKTKGLVTMMVGGGSNIIWRDEGFPGLVIVNKIMGFNPFNEDEENYYVTVGAGENWDEVVRRTVEAGATGIEALSLIPGTAGATPVQNVGAYGQEIAETLVSVEAFDTVERNFLNIPAMDCGFGYRTSRFKTTDRGRFYITAITLHLWRSNPLSPFYNSVQHYFTENGINNITPQVLREAVIAIRQAKLPDPAIVANTGSFFYNPIVDDATAMHMLADNPGLPHWRQDDGRVKLSAAWLIEQAGFKDFHDESTGMATWPAQPLVFINEKAQNTTALLAFRQKVLTAVQQKFNLTLSQEPELLP